MGKPGRRPSTSTEWKLGFIQRVIDARESTGMDQATFAKELSRVSGLNITYDSYRKYEILDPKKGALLRHDLIFAFCEITRTHTSALLAGDPFPKAIVTEIVRRKAS
jgi:hypothetical protein